MPLALPEERAGLMAAFLLKVIWLLVFLQF